MPSGQGGPRGFMSGRIERRMNYAEQEIGKQQGDWKKMQNEERRVQRRGRYLLTLKSGDAHTCVHGLIGPLQTPNGQTPRHCKIAISIKEYEIFSIVAPTAVGTDLQSL